MREEIKEHIKWNIDRSTPNDKLRELVFWSRDVMDDISYQKIIQRNPILAQLAKRWYLCVVIIIVALKMIYTTSCCTTVKALMETLIRMNVCDMSLYILKRRLLFDVTDLQ